VAAAKGGSRRERRRAAARDRGDGRDMPVGSPTADRFGSGEKAARPTEEHRGDLLDLRIPYRHR